MTDLKQVIETEIYTNEIESQRTARALETEGDAETHRGMISTPRRRKGALHALLTQTTPIETEVNNSVDFSSLPLEQIEICTGLEGNEIL